MTGQFTLLWQDFAFSNAGLFFMFLMRYIVGYEKSGVSLGKNEKILQVLGVG
jgi:hypothetical protein